MFITALAMSTFLTTSTYFYRADEDYETAVRNLKGKLYPDCATPGSGKLYQMDAINPFNI